MMIRKEGAMMTRKKKEAFQDAIHEGDPANGL